MRVTGATIALAIWFAVMLVSVVVATVLGIRDGRKGISQGLQTILGGLLMGAFVSAIIGLYEMERYYFTLLFWVSILIGGIGLLWFIRGLFKLRRNRSPVEPKAQPDTL
ncbi:MAG: hypothetical protein ABIR24_15060 [Verrucomicrobiota bacterium]